LDLPLGLSLVANKFFVGRFGFKVLGECGLRWEVWVTVEISTARGKQK